MSEQPGSAPMPDDEDPVDYAATSRPRAGLIMKDTRELPGLALLVVAFVAFVGCLTAAAAGSFFWAIGLGAAAVIFAVVGGVSISVQRRRVAPPTTGRHRAITTR